MIEYSSKRDKEALPLALNKPQTMLDPVETEYMRYLPNIYHNDLLMQRILRILEEPLVGFERLIDMLVYYIDPRTTPSQMLPFMAQWVDMRLHQRWSIERQRELIMRAVEIFRWRGTVTGLKLFIELLTGFECDITQTFLGFRLGSEHCVMGRHTLMASGPDRTFVVTIKAKVNDTEEMLIRQVIDREKPAHAAYELRFEPGVEFGGIPGISHD